MVDAPNEQPRPDRIDPASGLALPDPFPEYLTCPQCGEAEIEVFCYQTEARCHNCGTLIPHAAPPGCGTYPYCRRGAAPSAG